VVSSGLLLFLACCFLPSFARNQEKPPQPLKQDEACLACHGQADMKSEKGVDISIRPEKHAASVHGILGCKDCHTAIKDFPHPTKISKVKCATCHAEEAADAAKSIHAVLGDAACASCHGKLHEIVAAAKVQPAKCTECHADESKAFAQSVHGLAAKAGDPDAPTCTSCHGPVHKIQVPSEAVSKVAKKNLPAACATCHADAGFLSRHKIPTLYPVEQYLQSVHGRAVLAGKDAATCSDCHGSHEIFPARDTRSRVSHWNVAATCGTCHKEIAKTFLESVHGRAIKAGVRDAPDCTACHGEHLILEPKNPDSPVNAAHVSVDTCERCHGDARLARRYDLPGDRVPSYAESLHGLAKRGGSLTVANCASCHGVHNIFRSNDSRSTVNAANLAKTCGQCHAGVNEKLAIGPVHVQTTTGPAHPVVRCIRGVYWVLIPLTLGFMVLHNLLDLFAKAKRGAARVNSGQQVVRMNLSFRIAHCGVMLSFPTLVFTGFALKYPDSWWSAPFVLWGRREALRGELHRTAAVILIAATLSLRAPGRKPARSRISVRHAPQVEGCDRFSWRAALQFWREEARTQIRKIQLRGETRILGVPVGGTAVMALSGFLLWFNNFALRHFPKWITDVATAVHWYEALLATFSILLWHFYMVIFDPLVYPMDLAWLTGKAPADHYRHTRPEYLRVLELAGPAESASARTEAAEQSTESHGGFRPEKGQSQ